MLREFEGQVVVFYDDLSPIEWVEMLNIRREIKEKQYKAIKEQEEALKTNIDSAGNEQQKVKDETNLLSRRMNGINHILTNAPR